MASILQIAPALLLLGAVTFALFQSDARRIETVAFEIPNSLLLDQHRRAISHLLKEAPTLRKIELRLGDGFVADQASIRALNQIQSILVRARVGLWISATPPVAAALTANGLSTSARVSVPAPVVMRRRPRPARRVRMRRSAGRSAC